MEAKNPSKNAHFYWTLDFGDLYRKPKNREKRNFLERFLHVLWVGFHKNTH